MLQSILPERLYSAIKLLDTNKICEIRMRRDSPIIIDAGRRFFLGAKGIASSSDDQITISEQELESIVFRACECSMYAHNDELKSGFVTLSNGVRIGICGEVVYHNGQVATIKNFSSLNIRIPHLIYGISDKIIPLIFADNRILNTLIISPAGCGKTTMLRDLVDNIGKNYLCKNILVIDERREICAKINKNTSLLVDVYTGADKLWGIQQGVRVMSPDVIVLDELGNEMDIRAVIGMAGLGVKFLATAHARDFADLQKKVTFESILSSGLIERYVVLSDRAGVGTLEGVFDAKGNRVSE